MGQLTMAQPMVEPRTTVILTAREAQEIAAAIWCEFASDWGAKSSPAMPERESVARLRAIVEVHASRLERLQWGESQVDIELALPTRFLDDVAKDLVSDDPAPDRDIVVCAVIQHLLESFA